MLKEFSIFDETGYLNIEQCMDEYPDVSVWNIVGAGGAGKTYSIKRHFLNYFLETDRHFIYVRRSVDEAKSKYIKDLFSDVWETESSIRLAYQTKYKLDDGYIKMYGSEFWFCGTTVAGKSKKGVYIGKAMSVKNGMSSKGAPLNSYGRVLYDECITEGYYFHGMNEPELFGKIIDTIARKDNTDVKVFLCGNPDADIEQCPYFYKLHIEYDALPDNQVVLFDSEGLDGHLIKNNVAFIKLIVDPEKGSGFLNLKLAGAFGVAESYMRLTGEVKTHNFKRVTQSELPHYKIALELEVETGVVSSGPYHKCVYVYLGYNEFNEPVILCMSHKWGDWTGESIYSYFDQVEQRNDVRQRVRVFRAQWPSYLRAISQHIEDAQRLANVYGQSDRVAQTFLNLIAA